MKKTEWSKTWNGHEIQQTWELLSPMHVNSFFSIVNNFYDEKKTISIWKSGFINRDTSCDIQIRFNTSKSIQII